MLLDIFAGAAMADGHLLHEPFGLIVGVVDELGLKDRNGMKLAAYDEVTYSKEPDGAYLIQKLTGLLEEVPILIASHAMKHWNFLLRM